MRLPEMTISRDRVGAGGIGRSLGDGGGVDAGERRSVSGRIRGGTRLKLFSGPVQIRQRCGRAGEVPGL